LRKNSVLAFLLGSSSIIAQALILRTFQVVFYGNELSYAVILSTWLFWVGVGSMVSSAVFSKIAFPRSIIAAAFSALALAIPVLVFGIRYIKPIFQIEPGQLIGLGAMAVSAVILTAPAGCLIGMIFVLLCRQAQDELSGKAESAGRVYFFESLGSAVGGMLFSFVLLIFFNATMIAWMAAGAMLSVLLIIYRRQRPVMIALAALLIFIIVFMKVDYFYHLNFLSHQKQWAHGRLLAVEDSPYANIAVVEHEGEVSFYQNGLLSFTAGDRLSAEGNVHLAMLAHPFPYRVLLIGNGLGGELKEILKYPNVEVDFVEIDSRLVDLAREYLPKDDAAVLGHPQLRVHSVDARLFVRTAEKNYDVIIVNAGDPYTSGINRYYTLEFFGEVDRILDLGGIVSLRVSSSENYLNEENRIFLRSLDETLKNVFPGVRSIPGGTHTFLASNITDRVDVDIGLMIDRLNSSGIKNRFINEHTLPFILDDRRMVNVEKILSEDAGLINRDLFPRGYLFSIILWAAHFDMGLKGLIHIFYIPFWAVLISVIAVVFGIAMWRKRSGIQSCIDLAVATTGFSEIVFEIVVILAFQSLYGIAYHRIGFILAAFMFGLVAGARWALRMIQNNQTDIFRIFRRTQCAVVFYPLLLPVLFVIFRDASFAQRWPEAASFVFAFLPFIAGLLGGLQYPLAAALRRRAYPEEMKKADAGGILYAMDAFGASIGALVTGMFLIPVYGIVAVCILCAAMNGAVLLFLLMRK
jgi:spermidine synthase